MSLGSINTKRLWSNAGLSVLQVLVSVALLFVLYRQILSQLGPEIVGLWSTVLASVSVARLSDIGFSASLVRFAAIYKARSDDVAVSEIVQTAALTTCAIVGGALLVLYVPMKHVLGWSIEQRFQADALDILPWALASFWLNAISSSFQSGLDGCQRTGLRQVILMVGSAVFVGFAVWEMPRSGVLGLAQAQLFQSIVVLLASWFALRRYVKLPWIPNSWSFARLKEIFGYSMHFQLGSIATMLCEPLTKVLLARFGGLAMTGLYEMAFQVVSKARAIIYSATQVLVPAIADVAERDRSRLRSLYVKTFQGTAIVIFPFYFVLSLLFPLIAQIWIGSLPSDFIPFGLALTMAYLLNGLEVPAHIDNLGTGNMRINTAGLVLMALLNVTLGWVGGALIGGYGVVFGFILALLIASAMVVRNVHARYDISAQDLIPDCLRCHAYAAIVFAAVIVSLIAALQPKLSTPIWVTTTASALLFVGSYALLIVSGRSVLARARIASYASL